MIKVNSKHKQFIMCSKRPKNHRVLRIKKLGRIWWNLTLIYP